MTSTILAALREEFGASSNVTYALGSNPYSVASPTAIADAAALAGASQLTVLALGLGCDIEAEGRDRPFLYLPAVQDALLAAVSGAVRRGGGALLLVTVSANIIDLDAALADAWVQLFLPGEEAGHGFVDVAVGRVSPSGRLPLTGYANEYLDVAGPTADFNVCARASAPAPDRARKARHEKPPLHPTRDSTWTLPKTDGERYRRGPHVPLRGPHPRGHD